MFFIGLSTILLAFEKPTDNPQSTKTHNLELIDNIMTAIFLVEMLIKIAALGFVFNG